jgi:hypothetical protein
MRDFHLLWHMSNAGLNGHIAMKISLTTAEYEHLFLIRALHDADPVSYLDNLVNAMVEAIASPSENSFPRWLMKAKAEAQFVLQVKLLGNL